MIKALLALLSGNKSTQATAALAVNVAPYRISEGVGGHHHYHLQQIGKAGAICGARTMQTSIPLSAWGVVSHLNERWCEECEKTRCERSAEG
jgi:hypothetical protein